MPPVAKVLAGYFKQTEVNHEFLDFKYLGDVVEFVELLYRCISAKETEALRSRAHQSE
jgi:hypothetical protein